MQQIKANQPIPVEFSLGKESWILKARAAGLECACWDCLRRAGITPARNSPPQHRSGIIVGIIYRTDNGSHGRSDKT